MGVQLSANYDDYSGSDNDDDNGDSDDNENNPSMWYFVQMTDMIHSPLVPLSSPTWYPMLSLSPHPTTPLPNALACSYALACLGPPHTRNYQASIIWAGP